MGLGLDLMMDARGVRLLRRLAVAGALLMIGTVGALAQTPSSTSETPSTPPQAAQSTPKATPTPSTTSPAAPTSTPSKSATPEPKASEPKTSEPKASEPKAPASNAPTPDAGTTEGKPGNTEIEPNGSPGIPQNATTESVNVPARPAVMIPGQSSYDDAFKSIRASLDQVRTAMEKAGLKPSGHPITIFSEPDEKGFKYKVAIPIAAKPEGKVDLGAASIGETPSGKAIKFQHRGAYEDIDSTYDVITAYLDAKGLQAENPYIEEYLNELTTADDPNLQVDIYVFVKK